MTDISAVQTLMADEMANVNELIHRRLKSRVALIDQLSHYIINSGGKRLRPLLVLLSARALGHSGQDHIQLAAIVEFIHTATLLHDDVVDGSEMRRGQETANHVWGNEASVLVGDFLYSRAFELMVELKNERIMEIMAHATNTIAEGEVLQLINSHEADTTEETYIEVIQFKTAKLFEAATQLGAIVSSDGASHEAAIAKYGMHIGTAFQLTDDVLDYSALPEETGKNIGDDLAEGKPTLPLIHAMRTGTPEQATVIRKAIESGGLDTIDEVFAAIESTGALAYTARAAMDESQRAIEALKDIPDSPYREAMVSLAQFASTRTY